jgi:FKBP-type peptidyl-prolyl cis-trans isomerase SlyD
MKIAKGKSALLVYDLYTVEDNKLIERVTEKHPANFKFGTGQLIDGFEENLIGLQTGDLFDFVIDAESAYGKRDPYAIFDIPKDTFSVNGEIKEDLLQVGRTFPMQDNMGNRHMGKIVAILDDAVTMDFNHPLAGKSLRFKGKIIEVK